jgi:SOS-response transcriptional repressor LexA
MSNGGAGVAFEEKGQSCVFHTLVDLDAIREQGRDALDSPGSGRAAEAKLSEVEIATAGRYHEVMILRADDIFECAAASGSMRPPIPAQGKVTRVVLHLRFSGAPESATVEIHVPNSVEVKPASAAEKGYEWFSKSPFAGSGKLTHVLLILALAVSTAVAGSFDDREEEDDDGDDVEVEWARPRMGQAAAALRSAFSLSGLTGLGYTAHMSSIKEFVAKMDGVRALVPLFGCIPAGFAREREQEEGGCVTVDISMVGFRPTRNTFALQVLGDSMIGRHICDGDIVVLEHGGEPRPGQIVAALVDGRSTLKTYLIRGGRPFLKAENPRYPAMIPGEELVIQGVVVTVVRKAE